MKNIRTNIFETNSSSVHAIVIDKDPIVTDIPKLPKKIIIEQKYFGWENKIYNTWESKLDYLCAAIYCCSYGDFMTTLKSYLKNLGVEEIIINSCGIDHSIYCYKFIKFVLSDYSNLCRYLFSDDSIVVTGNDNNDVYDPGSSEALLEMAKDKNVVIFVKNN